MGTRFTPCAVDGCAGNAHRDANGKAGYCSKHYQRLRKHGDPNVVLATPSPAVDWIRSHAAHQGEECLSWPFHVGRDGYGRVHDPDNGGALTTASRLMCVAAHGAPPSPRHEAAHSCGMGNRGCVNPKHLYWATPVENHADKIEHGTTNRGGRQWQAKLTEDDVRTIRRLLGMQTQASLAARYGVDASVISDIKRGVRWGWLA